MNRFLFRPSFTRTVFKPKYSSSLSIVNHSTFVGVPVDVKAYYFAGSVDIVKVRSAVYGSSQYQDFQKKSATITIDQNLNQYVVIFKYGSVVFFNIPEAQHLEHLRKIKDVAVTLPIDEELLHTEKYLLMIDEHLERPSSIQPEHMNIRNLDFKNIIIVSTIMSQTVALDYYTSVVGKMLETFMTMNKRVEDGGDLSQDNKKLYRLIASNNAIIANVLFKLGIFEGTDAAWDNSDYHHTWEVLRRDFELDDSFKDLKMKLDIVKDNTQFFLEMLNNQNSTKLEHAIIGLIAIEVLIGIVGHILPHFPSLQQYF